VLGGDPATAAVLYPAGGVGARASGVRRFARSGAQQATLRASLGDKTFDAAYADGPILFDQIVAVRPSPSSTPTRTRLGRWRPDMR